MERRRNFPVDIFKEVINKATLFVIPVPKVPTVGSQ